MNDMKERMKIVAGLGRPDDYEAFVSAGADEVFIGYVPQKWQSEYGLYTPLNRREVCYYPVQIGSESELCILAAMIEKYGIPAVIAFNGLHYRPAHYAEIAHIMCVCREMGFSSVIIADPALLVYLHKEKLSGDFHIQISGEFGEINRYTVRELGALGAERLIFHRKVPVSDMRKITVDANGISRYEAFLLNEMCHFHGGYCNNLHCDELIPMCRMPYILTGGDIPKAPDRQLNPDALGAGGCGLCALWKLREAGVTHLKIVGRGAHSENMLRDICAVKTALTILYESPDEEKYIRRMKAQLFGEGCSERCYYMDIRSDME